jgi:hypothetical protein
MFSLALVCILEASMMMAEKAETCSKTWIIYVSAIYEFICFVGRIIR